jgi:hypothetical protein
LDEIKVFLCGGVSSAGGAFRLRRNAIFDCNPEFYNTRYICCEKDFA